MKEMEKKGMPIWAVTVEPLDFSIEAWWRLIVGWSDRTAYARCRMSRRQVFVGPKKIRRWVRKINSVECAFSSTPPGSANLGILHIHG